MVYIVSELGVNFSSIEMAKEMISASKRCGADAVKFQVYNHDNLYKVYPGGEVKRHPQYEELMKIKLGIDELEELKIHADTIGINIFATPMYIEAVDLLEEIGVDRYKIRYADRINHDLINKVSSTNKPIMISHDHCHQWKYKTLLNLKKNYHNVYFLYCIPEYPPSETKFKLSSPIDYYNSGFGGYSNHIPSIIPPLIAASRGARIIEVHVKFKDTAPLDNVVSITFEQLDQLVKTVREIEQYMQ